MRPQNPITTSPDAQASLVIGIDAGGTRIRVALGNRRDGIVDLRDVAADPAGGPEPALALITLLSQRRPVVACVAGIAKISRAGVAGTWQKALETALPGAVCRVVPDYEIAFHGALPAGIGLIVVAGTGSVVYGENGRGARVRVGGRGWEFGDEGSGAQMTAEAIRRTLRTLGGLVAPTALTTAIAQTLGSVDAGRVAEAARARAAAEGRGFLVPLLLAQARAGDPEARDLFVGAAGWLAAYLRAAARRLEMEAVDPLPVVGIGGLWEAGELLTEPLERIAVRWLPGFTLQDRPADPVVGALRQSLAIGSDGP